MRNLYVFQKALMYRRYKIPRNAPFDQRALLLAEDQPTGSCCSCEWAVPEALAFYGGVPRNVYKTFPSTDLAASLILNGANANFCKESQKRFRLEGRNFVKL